MWTHIHMNRLPGQPWSALMLVVGLAVVAASLAPGAARGETRLKTIHMLNLSNIYIGFNEKDAQLTYRVIMNKVIGDKYSQYRIVLAFPENITAAAKAVADGRGDLLTLTSLDYFRMRQTTALEPLAIMSKSDRSTEPYLFLAQAGMDFDKLTQKPVRTLIVENGGGDAAKVWLSVQLMENGLAPVAEFFAPIRMAQPSRAVLPIFFGQADACVVSASAFKIITDLNPQIEQKISLLNRSPGLVNLLVCGTKNLEPDDKRLILEELAALHNTPEGRQALTIMQLERFFLFEPDYLKATEALYNRYHRLLGEKY